MHTHRHVRAAANPLRGFPKERRGGGGGGKRGKGKGGSKDKLRIFFDPLRPEAVCLLGIVEGMLEYVISNQRFEALDLDSIWL